MEDNADQQGSSNLDEEFLWMQIGEKIHQAGRVMDLEDLPENATEEEYMELYEDRFHCGVCVTRAVLDVVWPSVEAYIDYLKEKASGGNVA